MNTLVDQQAKLYYKDGALQSADPAEYMFGYTYWASLIPPFKPETCLILGYGHGTVSKLIKLVWGNETKIRGVDIEDLPMEDVSNYSYDFVDHMNAFQYVRDEISQYDYVVVDLWNGPVPSSIIFDKEFIKNCAKVTGKLLSINVRKDDLPEILESAWCDHFHFDIGKTVADNAIVFFRRG